MFSRRSIIAAKVSFWLLVFIGVISIAVSVGTFNWMMLFAVIVSHITAGIIAFAIYAATGELNCNRWIKVAFMFLAYGSGGYLALGLIAFCKDDDLLLRDLDAKDLYSREMNRG